MHSSPSEPIKVLTPRAQDEGLAEFFTHSLTGMARVAPDGSFLAVNDAFSSMLGYSREELEQLNALQVTHPDDRADSTAFSKDVWSDSASEVPGTLQKRYIKKDGGTLHAEVQLTTICGLNGAPAHSLVQIIPAEERWHRHRVEGAHRRVFELLTEGLPLDTVLREILTRSEAGSANLRAMLLLTNDAETHFECGLAPSLSRSCIQALTGSEIVEGTGSCATGLHRGERVIVRDVFNDPLWVGFEDLAREADIGSCWSQPIIGEEGKRLGSFSLLSPAPNTPTAAEIVFIEGMANLAAIAIERHRVLEALRISRARFMTLVEHAPEAVLLFDCDDCCFVEANERVNDIFMRSPAELLRTDPITLAPAQQPDGRASLEGILEKIAAAKAGESQVFDWVILNSHGDQVHCEVRLVRLPTKTGTLLRGSVIDVGARRQAEHELRASKESLRATLDSIGDAVVAVDSHKRITHFNPVAEELIECRREAAIGREIDQVLSLLDPETREPLDPFTRSAQLAGSGAHAILASTTSPGVYVSDRVTPIRNSEGQVTGTVFVFRDVTAQRDAQERQLQAHKLEAIGQLAGGVAHDFNNLLTGILGNAELLAQTTDPETKRAASMISLAARRAADLTGQLLRFSRNEPQRRELLDVHELIRETCQLLEHSVDKRIELHLQLDATCTTLSGDASQLQNAFLNLGINARDALDGHGSITISTRDLCSDPPSVEISFVDTGTGIEPAIQAHIFEPFFTTKDVGSGTGLGLAGTFGIVHGHGGKVEVHSKPGEGACFTIELPCCEGTQPPRARVPAAPARGKGTVLVVDDEDLVRGFVIRALETFGYKAVGATNGLEAERLYTPGAFDLVILDLVMPKRSGLETFHVLTAIDAEVPILIASGYSRDHSVEEVLKAGAVGFLHKPFMLNELAAAVGKAIRKQPIN